jgi:phage-related baseplate assembly protein
MMKLVQYWASNDPPNAAQYDVGSLEFDPIKVNQEANTYAELTVRDRVNQAARAVTLAFAVGADLQAIGSRYPGGMPKLPNETDDQYRDRVWLSANTLSPHGVYESYVFWARTSNPELRDVTAYATPGKPDIYIPIMADGPPVIATTDSNGNPTLGPYPNPIPTNDQIGSVFNYIMLDSRRALTDVPHVTGPSKIIDATIDVDVTLYPGWDQNSTMVNLYVALARMIESNRWLGSPLTRQNVDAALAQAGVYDVTIHSPVADIIPPQGGVVRVTSGSLNYVGRGGYVGAMSG